jgi:proton-dependent oligopeptide transporter, POT family
MSDSDDTAQVGSIGDHDLSPADASIPKFSNQNWFGQPRGLSILFLTEMWAMGSFYGMRVLLIYYMTKQLGIGQRQSSLIYGAFAAAFYFTPLIGGMLTDRYLRKKIAVLFGALLMALGQFMMTSDALLLPALTVIALGNGFFLPSLSSQISLLYRQGDPRLASAYNIYYVGVNLGAFLAPFVCGTLGEVYGWHWGFAAAGFGMLLAIVIYLSGLRYLPRDPAKELRRGIVPLASPRSRYRRFGLFLGIMAVIVVFRGAYEQIGNTVMLWTDSGVDRHLTSGWTIPRTWFQALDPLLIILLTPLLVAYWTRSAKLGREHSSIAKMATGAAIIAISYLMIAAVAAWSDAQGIRASWVWLTLFFIVMTTGELFILPVGLGFFGRTAPAGHAATAIAIWFFAGFFGNLFAGALGTLWTQLPAGPYFSLIGAIAVVAALLLLLFKKAAVRAEQDNSRAVITA